MNWAPLRIAIGTVGGGLFGFYVMHKVENHHKVRNMNLHVVSAKHKLTT